MKHLLKFLLLVTLLFSCRKVQDAKITSSTCGSILIDVTDPHLVKPAADDVLALYKLSGDINKEASFRLSVISDQKLNPVVEYHLADGATTEQKNRTGDSHNRENLVLAFYESVRSSLLNFWATHDSVQSLSHSECISSILNEITRLSQSSCTDKFLIVFSDLQENAAFKSYTEENINLLNRNPEGLATHLLEQYTIPENLSGMTVYFINLPRNREEEEVFLKWVEVYKLLLEPRGAQIIVQAHNKFFIP
ncbi:MAG: hypothetical protein K1X61_13375 [Chitinophagales bacterium]|nr:hypothetical protein [Chitinophagales bacterium]